MNTETILEMLQRVRDGGLRPEEAMERLANLPYEEAGFAKIDHHRQLRERACPRSFTRRARRLSRWGKSSFAWPRWAAMCWQRAPMRPRSLQ